jgi:proton glutamate symport protein
MKLHWKIIIGMAAGVVVGLVINESSGAPGWIRTPVSFVFSPLIGPAGQIFIKLLKMLIVPLILASMIMGVARVGDIRRLGSLGGKTFVFYITTTFASVFVGLLLVNLIRPGLGAPEIGGDVPDIVRTHVTIGTILLNMIPANPVNAMAEMQILPLIVFSLLFGAVLTTIGDKGKPLIDLFESLETVMMKLTDWIIRLAPYGVFALLATVVAETGSGIFANLGKYMLTVVLGLAVHAFVTLPLLLRTIGGVSPKRYFGAVAPALTTAFSTASSSATLPLTLDCVENKAKVPRRISSFVLPLGATINMDGTALYESVAAVFIAQVYGIDLTFSQQFIIFLTATLAAIGAAGIPSAGLITMAIVLKAVGLPLEGIGMILAVDRLLDMCRTSVNVWGDTVGCAVVARLSGEPVPVEIGRN